MNEAHNKLAPVLNLLTQTVNAVQSFIFFRSKQYFHRAVARTSHGHVSSTAPPTFTPQLSAPGAASPTHPALRYAVVRSQSRRLQQIILPTGSATQLWAAEHSLGSQEEPREGGGGGLATTTPGKWHMKGIYFRGYSRQDNQLL